MATTIIINNKNYVADINRSIDCIPLSSDLPLRWDKEVGREGRSVLQLFDFVPSACCGIQAG